jgi:hypothetical protein
MVAGHREKRNKKNTSKARMLLKTNGEKISKISHAIMLMKIMDL